MAALLKILRVLVLLWFGVSSFPVFANAIYTYTGNNFDFIFSNENPPAGTYTKSMRVSGSFEVAAPLPGGLPLTVIAPLSFSFSDGRFTLTEGNSDFASLEIATDPSGAIISWHITVFTSFNFALFQVGDQSHIINTLSISPVSDDSASVLECTSVNQDGCAGKGQDDASVGLPGAWSVQLVSVPAPASLLLLGAGLAGLGWSRRRRR